LAFLLKKIFKEVFDPLKFDCLKFETNCKIANFSIILLPENSESFEQLETTPLAYANLRPPNHIKQTKALLIGRLCKEILGLDCVSVGALFAFFNAICLDFTNFRLLNFFMVIRQPARINPTVTVNLNFITYCFRPGAPATSFVIPLGYCFSE
jgi:hypothetical protein